MNGDSELLVVARKVGETMQHTFKAPLATITALGVAIALSGCGNLLEAGADKVGEAVQGQIEDQIRDNLDVDVQFGDNATLPSGFPASIPQPNGRIVGALGTSDGWSVSYELDGPTGVDPMIDGLVAQGYTVEQDLDQEGGRVLFLQGAEYAVAIVLIAEDGKALAQVTVTNAAE
ncbi:MAG: hypothetical protein CVT64_11870 [Actinobacteria bacterium HGW-Actinobacteria-4]|nr:MAG: hypothetical protein CVT64_11870 [Actinobacteria bacterium HGW-Actinobacteria-4]